MTETNIDTVTLTKEQLESRISSAVQEYSLTQRAQALADKEAILNTKALRLRNSEIRLRRWLQFFVLTVVAVAVGFGANATVAFLNHI
jgi:hypothetical protein